MNEQKTAIETYQFLLTKHTVTLQKKRTKRNQIGWLRLGVMVLTIFLAIEGFSIALPLGYIAIIAGVACFLILVSRDVENNKQITRFNQLIQLNEEELQILKGVYYNRFDGLKFQPEQHPYAGDLDMFGKASLYQYSNRCFSDQGQQRLAHNFLEGIPVTEALLRQDAAKELAPQVEWRQQLQTLLLSDPITTATEQKIESWLAEKDVHFTQKAWPIFLLIYIIITVGSALAALTGYIAPGLFSGLFALYFTIATLLSSKATKAYTQVNGIVKEISTLQFALQWIEEKAFQATALKDLQEAVKTNGENGYGEIEKLKVLLNRFDMRLNVYVFLFLNSFLLWDVRQMLSLNNWRQRNRGKAKAWFDAISEIEVLNSLATLRFNQPEWSWPKFSNHHFTFEGTAVGHPLLPLSQRVTSNFEIHGTAKIALITGSNMAGKSTFLRSLGVNIVLAQLGAPVCATALTISPVQLMSSMRIADNLAENTSTFYAELKKLKSIIEAVKTRKPFFILLDEVLRGTNSLDRHIGSKALIRQLIRENAVAVIATHDVEVAKLEETYTAAIHNYHFDVQVAGEELYFDYKLKEGVCTSLNASLLMKKIGIELDNEV
ncbi:MAG TPA: hypothetical protein VM010_03860 [Chitinophagaceae bacterium]|nr:hypothetical protein [Chitinophagaceae bacterium]